MSGLPLPVESGAVGARISVNVWASWDPQRGHWRVVVGSLGEVEVLTLQIAVGKGVIDDFGNLVIVGWLR